MIQMGAAFRSDPEYSRVCYVGSICWTQGIIILSNQVEVFVFHFAFQKMDLGTGYRDYSSALMDKLQLVSVI